MDTISKTLIESSVELSTIDKKFLWFGTSNEVKKISDYKREFYVETSFVAEDHHHLYGSPWFLGRDIFNFLCKNGLSESDTFLDLGCGSLRNGIWLIPFLNKCKYFGIDNHLYGLKAATEYEIPLHSLEAKKPRLMWSDSFEVDRFNTLFDKVLIHSVLNHLDARSVNLALSKISQCIRKGGHVFVSFELPQERGKLLELYGFKVIKETSMYSVFAQINCKYFVMQKV